MSSIYMKSPRGNIRAWADDANGSSTGMSAPSPRPRVAPPPTSKADPGWWPIAATTSRRGRAPAPTALAHQQRAAAVPGSPLGVEHTGGAIGRVHHRVAEVAGRRRFLDFALLDLLLEHLRLDAELAH